MTRETVRATVTIWVAPGETIKCLDPWLSVACPEQAQRSEGAILPAATAEFHLNGNIPFYGDKVAGIR